MTASFGFHDHHSHPLLYSALRSGVDLSAAVSTQQLVQMLGDAPPLLSGRGGLRLGWGWHSGRIHLHAEHLAELPPTLVVNFSLHQILVNDSARGIIVRQFGEEILPVFDREWFERNTHVGWALLTALAGSPDALLAFFDDLAKVGIHSAEELLLTQAEHLDWIAQCGLSDRMRMWTAPVTYDALGESSRAAIAGIKLFTDGAIGTHSAAMWDSWSDHDDSIDAKSQPWPRGLLIYEDAVLLGHLRRAAEWETGVAIHAIGPRAIEQAISMIQQLGKLRDRIPEVRIEHAQFITQSQAQRARDMNVILSMQPNFNSDSQLYGGRIGRDLAECNNPFRMLIDEVGFLPGHDLVFGSDGMPHGIEEAWQAVCDSRILGQRLRREELERGYTRGA
ncbi:MAG: amidohydrolase family protein [Planctomycetota bacterium]